MLLKNYDSAEEEGVAGFAAHTAVVDPTAPEGAPPRESIEVRTLVVWRMKSTTRSIALALTRALAQTGKTTLVTSASCVSESITEPEMVVVATLIRL